MAKIRQSCFYIFILFIPLLGFSALKQSETGNKKIPVLRIAVASNFRPAMKKLVPLFLKTHAVTIRWQSASSGAIFNQIIHGAPYDLFLSADSQRPQKLIQKKLALSPSLQTYALGKLVWYEPDGTHPSLVKLSKDNQSDLPGVISIANPKTAPYGKAASEVIIKLKQNHIEFKKVIVASNILQAFQYIQTGNVNAGFVAYAQIINQKLKNNFWLIPVEWYQPIKQQAVIIPSAHKKMAQQFLVFLGSETAQKIISEMGYDLPGPTTVLKEKVHAVR